MEIQSYAPQPRDNPKDDTWDNVSKILGVVNPTIGALSSVGQLAYGYFGGKEQRKAQKQAVQQQQDFQERMSNTAHQRQIADLASAGLNPILSAKYGGSSTPSGATYNPENKALRMAQVMQAVSTAKASMANSRIAEQEANWYANQGYPKSVGTQKPINTFFSQWLAQMPVKQRQDMYAQLNRLFTTSAKGGKVLMDALNPIVPGDPSPFNLSKFFNDDRLSPYAMEMLLESLSYALPGGNKFKNIWKPKNGKKSN